ncbi:hypothetical protein ADUPG1_004742, partial [Aduncisulcus paluster]
MDHYAEHILLIGLYFNKMIAPAQGADLPRGISSMIRLIMSSATSSVSFDRGIL